MTEGQKYTKCAGGCFLYAFSTLPNGTIFGHVWIALFFRQMTLVMRDSRQRGQEDEEEKTYNGGPVILQSNIAQQAGLLLSGTLTE